MIKCCLQVGVVLPVAHVDASDLLCQGLTLQHLDPGRAGEGHEHVVVEEPEPAAPPGRGRWENTGGAGRGGSEPAPAGAFQSGDGGIADSTGEVTGERMISR